MSNRTYICIPCRYSKRAEANFGLNNEMRCPQCRGKLWELEWKWRIPRKDDDKEWKALEKKVANESAERSNNLRKSREAKLEKIDLLIASTENLKESEKKTQSLKQLKHEKKTIQKKYTEL